MGKLRKSLNDLDGLWSIASYRHASPKLRDLHLHVIKTLKQIQGDGNNKKWSVKTQTMDIFISL
ncbi:hypothetical protein ASU31_18175 [Pedobacter ginsenosidimutans]|uniref:Uncharacterized protein n=1 Tax=Pedobacter ginsenosidimutans TaxID=687842 RepID=A0A0T5VLX2_9SPHI|nr:hypothetical protein ASU31_18175 [Pedobacter ginsenosidimutans]